MLALPERSITTLDHIHHSDALTLLRALASQSVDAIITDMPYGTTACSWDTVIDLAAWWVQVKRVLKPRGVFVTTAAQPFTSALVMSNPAWFKYCWFWKKSRPASFLHAKNAPLKNIEEIPVFSHAAIAHVSHTDIIRMNYYPQNLKPAYEVRKQSAETKAAGYTTIRPSDRDVVISEWENYPTTLLEFESMSNTIHPTQKPVALYEYLIQTYTRSGELVVDPFSGSGTTAVAARKTGRHFICGDSSAEYVAMSRKRLADTDPYQHKQVGSMKQLSMFAAAQP